MKDTILFDLGNTLVQYFEMSEFPILLQKAIADVELFLRQEGLLTIAATTLQSRVRDEDYEAKDYQVRPLEERLIRIFQLDVPTLPSGILGDLCRSFMRPIFARAQRYGDTLPTLQALKSSGFKTAIVSNTTWGSPAQLWREEVERLGLSPYIDVLVFCRDVGWRKPARQIFEFALEKVRAAPQQCVFVGDDPRWDIVGPKAVGIEAVLLDRVGSTDTAEENAIRTLHELPSRMGF